MSNIVELRKNDFSILEGQMLSHGKYKNKLVLVLFKANWCGYCQRFFPTFKKLADNNPNIIFALVDADSEKKLIGEISDLQYPMYRVDGYPTIVLYKNQRFVRKIDDRSEESLQRMLSTELRFLGSC